MKFYKIINWVKENGEADYKGLDTSQFVFESQFYDFKNKVCVIATRQLNFAGHKEAIELTEAQYKEAAEIINEINKPIIPPEDPNTGGEKITLLESALAETTALLAEQTERNIRNEQAIAELTTMIAGGNA